MPFKYKNALIIFSLFTFFAFNLSDITLEKITGRFHFLLKNYPHEKVYLQTDKPHYVIGDTLWFSAFVTDAAFYEINPVSTLVYIQISDAADNTVKKIKIKINGKNGHGFLPLNNDFDPGSYTLQAYTAYQLNYDKEYLFSKEIQIWSSGQIEKLSTGQINENGNVQTTQKSDDLLPIVHFYPEGGDLVDGLESVIAYEITDDMGNPINKSITILNEADSTIVQSKVLLNGKGFFPLKPSAGLNYYALIEGYNEKFRLPEIKSKGYNMRVINRNNDYFSVTVSTNMAEGLDNAFLVGHIRGDVFFSKDNLQGNTFTVKINKADLTNGVGQITLFNNKGLPVSERAIFIYNPNETPDVKIEIPYSYFLPKSKAEFTVLLTDKNGNPVQGNFCTSIVDASKVHYSTGDENITSFFLLSSDLTKVISRPGDFFTDVSAKKMALLDLEMMTQRWKRFTHDLLCSEEEPKLTYGPEHGLTIRGTVFKNGKPKDNLKVDLSILEGGLYVDETTSDIYGRFAFYDVNAVKGQTIHLKAYELKAGKKPDESNIKLALENLNEYKKNIITGRKIHWSDQFNPKDFLATSLEKLRTDSVYADLSVDLNEISIKSKRISRNQQLTKERNIIYGTPQKRMELDSMPIKNPTWNVLELVAFNTPGARLVGLRGPGQSIRLSGSPRQGAPLILMDGAPISMETASILDINSLAFFDVLPRLSAAVMFGDQAEGGVIALYSRLGGTPEQKTALENVAKYIADGFQDDRPFYIHDYAKASAISKPDIRTTLFWAPNLSTDEDGIAQFHFYTSESAAKYLIKVEGMTVDGRPFNGIHYFDVK